MSVAEHIQHRWTRFTAATEINRINGNAAPAIRKDQAMISDSNPPEKRLQVIDLKAYLLFESIGFQSRLMNIQQAAFNLLEN